MKFEKPILAPSILSANFWNLGVDIRQVEDAGCKWLHIDVMDGHFVPNITIGPLVVRAISKRTDMIKDVHLMIERPTEYIKSFIEAGADLLTVHYESGTEHLEAIKIIKERGIKAGISIKPDTPVSAIKGLLSEVDLVLIMSVHPGFGGQKFIPGSLERIRNIKAEIEKQHVDVLIEVDGGINISTIKDACKAGAEILVAGSAIFNDMASINKNVKDLMAELS